MSDTARWSSGTTSSPDYDFGRDPPDAPAAARADDGARRAARRPRPARASRSGAPTSALRRPARARARPDVRRLGQARARRPHGPAVAALRARHRRRAGVPAHARGGGAGHRCDGRGGAGGLERHAQHAVNISGGLHHAMRDRASGFCVYDDPAVAIAWLLAQGATRVAYVDVDVHHGDGVEAAFYDDPRVLTLSLHESGRTLFPGTGWADQVGDGDGRRHERQRRPADGHRRRRLAARLRGRRPAGAAGVPRRRCCSPSTAATPTRSTRWPTC